MKAGLLAVGDDAAQAIASEFRTHVQSAAFPCVGAKSALARDMLEIVVGFDMRSAWDDLRIHDHLMDWARRYRDKPGGLRSIAVIFQQPGTIDEEEFEELLWQRLQSFADKDNWLGQPYDPRVSANPDDPHFSLSFGGEAYFVVGLHPSASRPARRFAHPAMVFNLHDQFEGLRESGRYERMREAILERDRALAGSVNPMLARHGESSEARQYSGRKVSDEWTCPFQDPRAAKP